MMFQAALDNLCNHYLPLYLGICPVLIIQYKHTTVHGKVNDTHLVTQLVLCRTEEVVLSTIK